MNKAIIVAIAAVVILGIGGVTAVKMNKKQAVSKVVEQVVVSPSPETKVVKEPELAMVASKEVNLKITSPKSGEKMGAKSVVVRGVTIPLAEVSVNERDVMADAKGNFAVTVTLDEGENYIMVVAVDADGNASSQELLVVSETYE